MRILFVIVVSLFTFNVIASNNVFVRLKNYRDYNVNPFAGVYANWENRQTTEEEVKQRLEELTIDLCKDSPQSNPEHIKNFIEYLYVGGPATIDPATVETEPFDEIWAEIDRITRLFWSNQATEGKAAARRIAKRLPQSSLARVFITHFIQCNYRSSEDEYTAWENRLLSEIEKAVIAGDNKGESCYTWYYSMVSGSTPAQKNYFWGRLEERLRTHNQNIDPWFLAMIKGRASIEWAWISRGGGWGSTVTQEGWEGFSKNLNLAKEYFNTAISLHPNRVSAYIRLIPIEMGLSNFNSMVDAFINVIQLDPENESGYQAILWGLRPRWGGSHKLMRDLAIEAMDCPKRETGIPALGYQCLGSIAYDYNGMDWQNVYINSEVMEKSAKLFAEYEKKYEDYRDYFLTYRFYHEMAELRYDDAKETLIEYGGAEKFANARKGNWQRSTSYNHLLGTPYFDDILLRLRVFTGIHAEKLCRAEKLFLANTKSKEAFKLLDEIVSEKNLSQEELDFIIDLYARWYLNCSPYEFCGTNGAILSAFTVAGKLNKTEISMAMIALGYDYQKYENSPGEVAYNIAESGKGIELLYKLKELGVDLTLNVEPLGYAPIHIATVNGHADMVEALLKLGVPINQKSRNGHNGLHLAATKKYRDVVNVFLANGADPNSKDNDGDVCLIYLPQVRAEAAIYKIFLNHPTIDLNAQNNSGDTPLHYMARFDTEVEIFKLFYKHNADFNILNNSTKTPLDIAKERGNNTLVNYLISIGSKYGSELPKPVAQKRPTNLLEKFSQLSYLQAKYLYMIAGLLIILAVLGVIRKKSKGE